MSHPPGVIPYRFSASVISGPLLDLLKEISLKCLLKHIVLPIALGTVIGLKSSSNRNAFYVRATADPEGIFVNVSCSHF